MKSLFRDILNDSKKQGKVTIEAAEGKNNWFRWNNLVPHCGRELSFCDAKNNHVSGKVVGSSTHIEEYKSYNGHFFIERNVPVIDCDKKIYLL